MEAFASLKLEQKAETSGCWRCPLHPAPPRRRGSAERLQSRLCLLPLQGGNHQQEHVAPGCGPAPGLWCVVQPGFEPVEHHPRPPVNHQGHWKPDRLPALPHLPAPVASSGDRSLVSAAVTVVSADVTRSLSTCVCVKQFSFSHLQTLKLDRRQRRCCSSLLLKVSDEPLPPQLLDGLEVLQRNALTPLQQEFIAHSITSTYRNLTAPQFSRSRLVPGLVWFTTFPSWPPRAGLTRSCLSFQAGQPVVPRSPRRSAGLQTLGNLWAPPEPGPELHA